MNQPPEEPRESTAEIDHMGKVDRHDWGPTEPDEEAVLAKLYGYDESNGTYHYQIGDPSA